MNAEIISTALGEYGVHEYSGARHNPEVLKYFEATDYNGEHWITDEVAWCGAFMNWIAQQCGCERTGELTARSWLSVGEAVIEPQPGDVVIFWRESRSSWKGHVGIFIREDETGIWTLGGNQGNRVSIISYPKYRLLGFRRLKKIVS